MIPFAASTTRYSEWLRILIEKDAEKPFPSISGKEQARTRIEGGQMLSVPVEGGGSKLKRNCGEEVMISEHGRWRDVHLGAIRAAYGKTPYFPHLFPEIEKIYEEKSRGSLQEFNHSLHQLALRWLGVEIEDEGIIEELKRLPEEKRRIIKAIGEERGKDIDMEDSIFSLLFRLGKEGVYVLTGMAAPLAHRRLHTISENADENSAQR